MKCVQSKLIQGFSVKNGFSRSFATTTAKKNLKSIQARNQGKVLPDNSALVVGGTSGIGEGVARRLAKAKVSVTIAGRNEKRGKEIVAELQNLSSDSSVKHSFIPIDTLLMRNIGDLCREYSKQNTKLDYLVLSQGIGTMQGRTETAEGIDQKLQLHYFGRMYFVEKLLPLLRASKKGGKTLSVFSAGVHQSYLDYAKDFELKGNYSLTNAANAPGMYTDLCLDAFSKQPGNERLAFIHAAPGIVSTNADRNLPYAIQLLSKVLKPLLAKSIDDAGEIMADPLIGGDIEFGFHLLDQNGNPTKETSLHTAATREFVWEKTQELFARFSKD